MYATRKKSIMIKVRAVFIHEFLTVLRSRSFLLTLFLIPLAGFATILIIAKLKKDNQGIPLTSIIAPSSEPKPLGLIDQSGIIQTIPESFSKHITEFPDPASAQAALANEVISGYYVVLPDYLTSGQVDYYRSDFNPIGGGSDSYVLRALLEENLLRADPQRLKLFQQPVKLETHFASAAPQRDPDSALTFFLPYAVTMLFYLLILGSSSTMLNSITNEKQNRVMEILLTSMTPLQMLTGKIIALGLIGLFQTAFWSGSAFMLYRLSGQTFHLPIEFSLPASLLAWGLLYFVLGYAIYASLMAGVGAMVPNLREGSQVTFMVVIPLMIPLFFINTLISAPNGSIALFLSLFPLTAPIAMLTRLAATQVPFWQPALAAVLQIGTAILVVRAIAGLFRAQTLLSGQAFKMKLFFRALVGKA